MAGLGITLLPLRFAQGFGSLAQNDITRRFEAKLR